MLKGLIICGLLFLPALIIGEESNKFLLQKNEISNFVNELPMTFTENRGQWDESILFRSDANGAVMWFTKSGAIYQFMRQVDDGVDKTNLSIDMMQTEPIAYQSLMIKANFVGANPNPLMSGITRLDHYNNYFVGNDKTIWTTDVPNYAAIQYEEIYNGIDLKYYGNSKLMEYDFIVSPGADFSQINVQYEGAKSLSVDSYGRLVVQTEWGTVTEEKPVIFQNIDGRRRLVTGEYILKDDNTFGFNITQDYNKGIPLVIDPVLSYSTYLGGYADDQCFDLAVDNSGNAYIVGYTYSKEFPLIDPYQSTLDTAFGNIDVFVTKFNSNGDAILFSTFLGGVSGDYGQSIDLDINNNIYISGRTASTDFPTQNAYQNANAGGTNDIFVSKIGSAGNTLEYSTYLGGSFDEDGVIRVDNNGNVYIAGRTQSTDFPTQNAYQATYGGGQYDGFITKLNINSNTLIYSTYFGTSEWDVVGDFEIDNNGYVYVVGSTPSTTFPLKNSYQSVYGGGIYDMYVAKFGPDGDTLVFSTYLGGNDYDYGYGIALDQSNNVYVTGNTKSTNFPTQNPYQVSYGGGVYNVTLSKLGSTGSTLEYSTYLGKSGSGYVTSVKDIAVFNNRAYLIGHTNSTVFPTMLPYQSVKASGYDCFISIFSDSGNILEYSTFFGAYGTEYGYAISVTDDDEFYITGVTNATNFPTLYPYQDSLQDTLASPPLTYDVFVSKFTVDPITYTELINPGANIIAFGVDSQTITFDSVETGGIVIVEYATNGPTVGSNLTVIPADAPIFYNVSTTANFIGNAEVCFSYDPAGIVSEDSVKLYHFDSTGNWVDVTTSLDTTNNIVCGTVDYFSPFVVLVPDIALSVELIDLPNLPDEFSLSQNYPNPFNPETNIEFSLKTRSHVLINVYNILGRKVKTLVNNSFGVGNYIVSWDGTDERGNQISSGMYLYRFSVDGFVATKKMMLLK